MTIKREYDAKHCALVACEFYRGFAPIKDDNKNKKGEA
jgi:hypothetical protein